MRKIAAATAITAASALLAAALTLPSNLRDLDGRTERPHVTVRFDPGGSIGTYMKWYHRLADGNIQVRIVGTCISACTIILANPKASVCTIPEAKFGFHLASTNGKPDVEGTADLVRIFYPLAVQEWIKKHGPLTPKVIYMTGAEMIRLGVLEKCDG